MTTPTSAAPAHTPGATPPATTTPATTTTGTPAAATGQGQPAAQDPGTQQSTPTTPTAAAPGASPAPADQGSPGEITVKAPEGVVLDEELVKGLKGIAAEAKFGSEVAQKIVDLGVQMQARQAAALKEQLAQEQQKWEAELKNDKEFGGDNFERTTTEVKGFIAKFGGEDLLKELDALGVAKNPTLLKAFARAARATGEDRIDGNHGGGAQLSQEEELALLYPSMAKKK